MRARNTFTSLASARPLNAGTASRGAVVAVGKCRLASVSQRFGEVTLAELDISVFILSGRAATYLVHAAMRGPVTFDTLIAAGLRAPANLVLLATRPPKTANGANSAEYANAPSRS